VDNIVFVCRQKLSCQETSFGRWHRESNLSVLFVNSSVLQQHLVWNIGAAVTD